MGSLPLQSKKTMSHKHEHLLHSILQEAPGSNIHWREVESLLKHLGADIEPANGARFKVSLNGSTDFLHHPHHSSVCTRDHIKHLKAFLTQAHVGVPVASAAASASAAAASE
jgi:hypothetical protein